MTQSLARTDVDSTTTTPTVSQRLGRWVTDLRFEDIPAPVVERAKLHLLDAIGIGLAATEEEYADSVVGLVRDWGGNPQATMWRHGDRMPAAHAALVNGSFVHGLDFDDTHTGSITHVSSCVAPAALAVGEAVEASGRDLLTAAIAGYEVIARVGGVVPGGFHDRGFHATPICGTFGAAAIAGRLWGLDAGQIAHALGTTGSQAAGLQQFLDDGAWVKRLHPGWAAHAGITAAQLASRGFTGPAEVFEGRFGLFATHFQGADFDAERVVEGLGERWETQRIAFKPYPCCHLSHASMDAAREVVRSAGVVPSEIASIEALVPEGAVHIVCEPEEHKARPNTVYAAMFSLPYCIAVNVLRGDTTLDDFDEASRQDPEVLALSAKVSHRAVASQTFPDYMHGGVRITLADGRELVHDEPINRGHPDNPLSADEVQAKFRANAQRALSDGQVERAIEAVMTLDGDSTAAAVVTALVEPLR